MNDCRFEITSWNQEEPYFVAAVTPFPLAQPEASQEPEVQSLKDQLAKGVEDFLTLRSTPAGAQLPPEEIKALLTSFDLVGALLQTTGLSTTERARILASKTLLEWLQTAVPLLERDNAQFAAKAAHGAPWHSGSPRTTRAV